MKKSAVLFLLLLFCTSLSAQHSVKYSAAEIRLALNKLNVLGSVMYVAAHPDDENQGFLTYMSKGRLYRSAYLSLTRGDGGQNLLGPEKGEQLGIIRTQELLAARRLDGAQQFFTRAIDFGYSKSSDETLQKWGHDIILEDVVKVFRKFRPDVIVTRFTPVNGGHGHHLSSAILAEEAFKVAADPKQFPEQLRTLQTWQSKRIYWNSFFQNTARTASAPPLLALNFGEYNPLLGLSYQEIAAQSRSMHKTQGFGASAFRGDAISNFDYTAGDTAFNDLFDGIETSWKRVENSEEISLLANELAVKFNPGNPAASIPGLLKLYKLLEQHKRGFWIETKMAEVQKLIQMCSGLWMESIAVDESVTPGQIVKVRSNIVNRSNFPIHLNRISVSHAQKDSTFNFLLTQNTPQPLNSVVSIPADAEYSQPYWLKNPQSETLFNVDSKIFNGAAENNPALQAVFSLQFADQVFDYKVPVEYRWTDPIKGEQYKPFIIVPEISVGISQKSLVFAGEKSHKIQVTVKAGLDSVSGIVQAKLPANWSIEPASYKFNFTKRNEQSVYEFNIKPGAAATEGILSVYAQTGKKQFTQEVIKIAYDHIPEQTVLDPARAKLVKLDIIVPEKRIAYIMGSGDEIPQSLEQIGFKVDLLSDEDLNTVDYGIYDAVICGVRAFNTRDNLGLQQKRILQYVEDGGTWIVQHNTRFGNQVPQIGPYPFTAQGRDRISEEDAEMQILVPDHNVFNFPNKITQSDFEGWVQERGTYLAESWEGKLYPLLAGHDKNEPSKLGSLLYAPYGKGVYMFTALSWFRQLPEGVPGAYKLFVNMICAGDNPSLNN